MVVHPGFEPGTPWLKVKCSTIWANGPYSLNKLFGWGGRIRTYECGNQNPVPYRLATPHCVKNMGRATSFELATSRATIWRSTDWATPAIYLVRPERLEPPTHGLEGRCSILLSYGRISILLRALKALERVMGIGPTQPAWKASVLPLNYTRIVCLLTNARAVAKNYARLNAQKIISNQNFTVNLFSKRIW